LPPPTLTNGTRLGPYEILSPLGAGGMGEVYRATDTNLKRQVAIKVLPETMAADPERIARFRREAEVLAALNHPHIAHIFGLEKADGTIALVMELVEGSTLADLIAQDALAIEEALRIAKQIAEALEAAHEQGIIHRDLKPANIKVRPDGTVKVLDFGLAKAVEPTGAMSPSASLPPTITTPAMTQAGMVLGTAAYMSPEQAKGRIADKRSDLWAFGCVLYEMLAGTRAFAGDDAADTLAAVLRGDPDWSALPATTPAPIRRLLRRCLEKDRRNRLADAADARLEIDEALAGTPDAVTPSASTLVMAQPRWRTRALPIALGVLLGGTLIGAAMWRIAPPTPPAPIVTRFTIRLPESQPLTTGSNRRLVALSPDGTQMVYGANQRLYLRLSSDLEARPIAGTVMSGFPANPVFSPDGRSIAFWASGEQTLQTIAVSGGAATTVCPLDGPLGMSWDANGIVFGQSGKGIMRVSTAGGTPELLASSNNDEVMSDPQTLPGGQALVYTLATSPRGLAAWDHAQIIVQSLKSGERKVVVNGGSGARYVPTGHLVYAVGGTLFAVPFDVKRLEVDGGPVPIVEGVRREGNTGAAQFSVANAGSLVYLPPSTSSGQRGLALLDGKGGTERLEIAPGWYEHPRLSPDGRWLAFGTDDGEEAIVWIYELSGASSMRRLTFGGHNRFPIWSADGERVAFQSDREGDLGIFWQRADGSGTAERLTKTDKGTSHVPESWSPKGDRFSYSAIKGGEASLWTFSVQDRKAERFDDVRSSHLLNSVFSADGQWIAYTLRGGSAGGGGATAVYVQPFPATGAQYQISKDDGGHHPLWSRDGKELFYFPGGDRLVAVRVATRPGFTFANPAPVPAGLLPVNVTRETPRNYDLAPDGRFMTVVESGPAHSGAPVTQQIHVVLNWFEELKRLAPMK
jgi:serine/threonine-protein kinase